MNDWLFPGVLAAWPTPCQVSRLSRGQNETKLVLVLPMWTEAQLSLFQPCCMTVEWLVQAFASIVSSSQRSDMDEGPKRKDQEKNTLPSPTPILEREDESLQKSLIQRSSLAQHHSPLAMWNISPWTTRLFLLSTQPGDTSRSHTSPSVFH